MNNIYLIGMMGSGKSSVGSILAKKMEMSFIDLDDEIESDSGLTIGEIFDVYGENYFRKKETRILIDQKKSVVACGGGIVLKNKNFIKKKWYGYPFNSIN